MKFFIIMVGVFVAAVARGESLPKKRIEIGGVRYLYSNAYWIETGGYAHHQVVVVHPESSGFDDVSLDERLPRPFLCMKDLEVVLPHEGVYFLSVQNGRRVVRILDFGYQMPSDDPVKTEERIRHALARMPNKAPEPTP